MGYKQLYDEVFSGINRYRAAYNLGDLSLRDIAGAAKMGFTNMQQAEAFTNARDNYPNLENLFTTIGNAAVPLRRGANGDENLIARTTAGNPVATRLDPVMSAFGAKYISDRQFLANLSRDLRENPRLENQIIQAAREHPAEFAASMRTYNGSANQIETTLDRLLNPAPAPRAQPAAAAPTPARESRSDPSPAPAAATPTRDAPAIAAAPVAASAVEAALDDDYRGADPPPPTGRIEGSAGIVASDISRNGGIADKIADMAQNIFPEDAAQIGTFREQLKADTPAGQELRERIAANLNANPEFMNQMIEMQGEGEMPPQVRDLIRARGRPDFNRLLENPALLADNGFIDDMSGKLGMLNGNGFDIGGMLQGLMRMIEQFVGPEFMQAISGLFSGVQNMIGGLGQGGNFLSMGNGEGGMFSNLLSGFGQASDFGRAREGMERMALENGARAVDYNNDGVISDGYQYDAQGNRMKHEVTRPDGTKRMEDIYDPSKDDRVNYTDADGGKHKGFLTEGGGFSNWQGRPVQFIVTEVNDRGQATRGTNIIVNGAQVEITDATTGEPITRRPEAPEAGRQVAGANPNLRAPTMDRGMTPSDGASLTG